MRTYALLLAIAALSTGLTGTSTAQRPETTVFGVFDADTMYTVLPPDAIPAVRNPEYVTGEEAQSQMAPDEPVIGVFAGEEAVCWSTWHLDRHEIVNDYFAGRAIAATW